jgi:hypothetical protein
MKGKVYRTRNNSKIYHTRNNSKISRTRNNSKIQSKMVVRGNIYASLTHIQDRIMTFWHALVQKSCLTPPMVVEVPVSSQEYVQGQIII